MERCSRAARGGGVLGAPRSAPRAPPDRLGHLGQFQRHLAEAIATHGPLARLSPGASSTRPPPRMSAHPTQLSAAPAPSHPPSGPSAPKSKSCGGVREAAGGVGGQAQRTFQVGRDGNTQNETNLPPVRGGSQGGDAAAATSGSITTVFLSDPYCSHFARIGNLAQRKETKTKRFGAATCHSSLAPCNTGLSVRVRAHARTRAHTPGRLDHALLALRPSALPPVKTRRSTLPSHRAPRAAFATNQQSGK